MSEQPNPEIRCRELVEFITDYLDDALPSDRRMRFEEHLAFCGSCAAYVEQFRQTIRLMGLIREDELDPEWREQMLRDFEGFTT